MNKLATFKALVSGLPLSATDILTEALKESFGDGVVDLISLNKDNLRQRVRLSTRDPQVVLVILDKVSTDMCSNIENGLYSSDKFLSYSTDSELVQFLNNKYSINMSLPEESALEVIEEDTSPVDDEDLSKDVQEYLARIQDQEFLIQNLQGTIHELEVKIEQLRSGINEESSSEEIETLKNEILDLKGNISDLSTDNKSLKVQKESLEEHCTYLEQNIEKLKDSKESISAEYDKLNEELSKERVTSTQQSGLIRKLEQTVDSLKKEKNSLERTIEGFSVITEAKNSLETQLTSAQTKISNLTTDNSAKQEKIDSLQRTIDSFGNKDKQLSDLRADFDTVQQEKVSLSKKVSQYEEEIQKLQSKSTQESGNIEELNSRIKELESRLETDNISLTQLNQERVELLAKIDRLSKSTDRDTNVEDLVTELGNLRNENSKLKSGVFGQIASYAMPKSSSPIFLTRKGVTLKNTRFTFAGNSESRKGAYKCLLNELKGYNGNDRFLIVDVVSETSIDYVFEIKKVINGLDWFRKGGGIQRYLSNTCLKNVQVLSPGLGYFNEAYFLTIDWEQRLTDLENSGYKVVIFFGDVSNMCGRIFHESFADLGNSIIYVHGNAIGSRTIVSNLKGLSNGKSSIVAYFDFNKQIKRFYDMVAKTNECRVLSVLR